MATEVLSSSFKSDGVSVEFLKKLPTLKKVSEILDFNPDTTLVIYDRKLEKLDIVKKWLDTGQKVKYPVTAGEKLKDLESFPGHVKKMTRLLGPVSPSNMVILSLGGGSVGDFAGFFASVYKRGVPIIHLPSTLLAAMDSSHGGKTALNVASVKNQIGTFYPSRGVIIVREVFQTNPQPQVFSAAGELAKMALISGGGFFNQAKETYFTGLDDVWSFLPDAIKSKYDILKKDPKEKTGERQLLNLGHTFGHVIESYYGIPHGTSIGLGLVFVAHWSHHRGHLDFKQLEVITDFLHDKVGIQKVHQFLKSRRMLTRSRLQKLVSEDKKMTSPTHLNFIFLEDPGKVFRKTITIESFLTEAVRQGWASA